MATVNLGSIKFNWKGAYSGSTAYAVDDVVSYNGSSYVCTAASTGNLPTDTNFWDQMSSAGTDGTDLTTTLTTQGDILYRNGSGLQRLGAGTSGQYLETKGTGQNPVWSTVSSGAYSIAQFTAFNLQGETHAGATNTAYRVSSGSGALTITPTATTDLLQFCYATNVEGQQSAYYGQAIGMQTSNSGWTSNTSSGQLAIDLGEHAQGMGSGADSERYQHLEMNITISAGDLGMSAGTQYYFVPYITCHSPAGQIQTGKNSGGSTSNANRFSIMRYTSNS